MICYPNAKINIGLYITSKRDDGFHNIETILLPIKWCDILEFVPEQEKGNGRISFTSSGIRIPGNEADNICEKAYNLLSNDFNLPGLTSHLHKIIPVGAGLGGGSADGTFMLSSLNGFFDLNLSTAQLEKYAAKLGSDCAFFIENKPCFAWGRGELLQPIGLTLKEYTMVIVVPPVHVSTTEAYKGVIPAQPNFDLRQIGSLSVSQWKDTIFNHFEMSIFQKYPEIKEIKEELYRAGALYASMSGSGSAVYGIFKGKLKTPVKFDDCQVWQANNLIPREGV